MSVPRLSPRGANAPSVAGFNQAVVLDLIRRADGGLSRVELAGESGLSSQTVTNVVRRLIDAGLIREGARVVQGPGKPRTLLSIDPSGGYAIGVHLDPTLITYALVDLEGVVVSDTRIKTPRQVRPEPVLDGMHRAIEKLIDSAGIPRDRVLGVGIAAPGPVDRDAGIVDDPPLLSGWHRVPLRDSLAERLGLPVALDKDVSAVAVAESWSSSMLDAAIFYYGTGVGLGTVLGGEVVRGHSGNAGDIGHVRVSDTGPLCVCGQRGCLGANVSPAAIVRAAARRGLVESPAVDDWDAFDAAFTAVTARASNGEPQALALIDRVADDIAHGMVIISNVLDVSRVLCSGPYWDRLAPVALDRIRDRAASDAANVVPHPVSIDSTRLGPDIGGLGAARIVLDAVYSPRPATLLIRR